MRSDTKPRSSSASYTLADIITRALLAFEKRMLHRLQQHLHPAEQRLLDRLLAADDPDGSAAGETDAARRYPLTFLKRIRQGRRAGEIRERVTHFASLRQLFEQMQPLWQRLHLSDQAITYYAEYVLRAQAAQRWPVLNFGPKAAFNQCLDVSNSQLRIKTAIFGYQRPYS